MSKQIALRPQDIVIALRCCLGKRPDLQKDFADELGISPAEFIKSTRRLQLAKLLDEERSVDQKKLLNFLEHGLAVCFPVQLTGPCKGVPTAHSHRALKALQPSHANYKVVWPDKSSTQVGQGLTPLYKGVYKLKQKNPEMYKVLSLIDLLRFSDPKTTTKAIKLLKSFMG